MRITFAILVMFLVAPVAGAQESVPQTGHTNDILTVKFSPYDTELISYSAGDGRLILWDVKSGNLIWMVPTEYIQLADEYYNLKDFYWSEDGSVIVTSSRNGTFQCWDSNTGRLQSISERLPDIALATQMTGTLVVGHDYEKFSIHDTKSGADFTVKIFSRTGSSYDVSHDGTKFAEGGSWGDAGIRITDLTTGKSRTLYGREGPKRLPPYRPGVLEIRLAQERAQRVAVLQAAQARRDKQAATETPQYARQIYVTFDHYGDMNDPGEARIVESDEPGKSLVTKPAGDANAVWVRLHNDSPLPIEIPTISAYMPNKQCFYESPGGTRLLGLCDDREIGLWFGLENKSGKQIPYGFDFGSSAVLLPNTSVLFAVPREVLKGGNAVRFMYTFQSEYPGKGIEDYGEERIMRFREHDLPKAK